MHPRISIITLGMPDLAAARRFYVEGLGWAPTFEVPGEIVFVRVGHGLVLALWHAEELERDVDPRRAASEGAAQLPVAGEAGAMDEPRRTEEPAERGGERPDSGPARSRFAAVPMSLAHNVDSDEEVTEVLATAERAGGTVLKPAQRGSVGFVHGYFADPAGFRWEVAHNPGWVIKPDGSVLIGAPDQPGPA
jgi:catechol 2,3-dioxygenase-like lactoylglutathione lyase family enzyme